jgi:hypothetical protein
VIGRNYALAPEAEEPPPATEKAAPADAGTQPKTPPRVTKTAIASEVAAFYATLPPGQQAVFIRWLRAHRHESAFKTELTAQLVRDLRRPEGMLPDSDE